MGLRHWAMAAVATMTISAGAMAGTTTDTLMLDIQAGEPFGDTLARSTMQIETTIPLGQLAISLPELADWNGQRYQLRLQGGQDRSALIPWTPVSGTIWLHGGVISEIDLSFVNPRQTRADSPDWQRPLATLDHRPDTPDQVAGSLIALFEAIQSLAPTAVRTVSCGDNLPVTEAGSCPGVTVLTGPQTPETIRSAVTAFHADYAAALAQDPAVLDAPARRLVLGQWWLPNGNLIMLSAATMLETAAPTVPLEQRPVGLSISLNIKEFFKSNLGLLMASCFDQQALHPQVMAYTPRQAAQIFDGLFDDFYPPTVDGKAVTDMIALQQLDWARLTDQYWNDAEARRGFCTLLEQLQRDAGYAGPVAPLR